MRLRPSIIPVFLVCLMFFLLSSCLGNLDDTDMIAQYAWNPKVAVPLVSSEFDFDDFITAGDSNALIETDPNNLVLLTYQQDLISQGAEILFSIPNQSFSQTINIPDTLAAKLPIEGSITFKQELDLIFNFPQGERLDSADLKAGSLATSADWDFTQPGSFSLQYKSIERNGQSLQQSDTFDGSTAQRQFSGTQDLTGTWLDLSNQGTASNTFKVVVEITLQDNGTPLSSANNFNLQIQSTNSDFSALFGELTSRSIVSGIDTIELSFFNNINQGNFFLEDPQATFIFNNSFGLDVEVQLGQLTANSNTNGTLQLQGSITSPQIISAPDINNFNNTRITTITADKSNSNIRDLFAILPNHIFYQFDGVLNPGGSTSTYLFDSSQVDITLELTSPLYGRISNLVAEKDFEFEGQDLEDLSMALFQVAAENEFPLDVDLQVLFLDVNMNLLDSLITGDRNIIPSSMVDGQGLLASPGQKITTVEVSEDQITRITNATTLRLRAIISTTDNGTQSVQILNTYRLRINVGLQTEFEVKIG